MPTLTIITLTRNRLARLLRCLERLRAQLQAGDEVLVIDTGSADGTREHFRREPPEQVRFFELDRPGSWAEARNFAVARARGGLIAFLDDDCIPAPDWVARGRGALADADAVGGMVRAHGLKSFPGWWHPAMGWMVGLSVPGHAGPDAGRVHYPMTSNLWARAGACRAVPFQEIGGRFEGAGARKYLAGREDAQWWRALRTGGYRTRFDPELWVGHAIDPERLDLNYLRERAAMDGRAWAAREGTADDFAPTAYQWWHLLACQWGALGVATNELRCHWHYHRLSRVRQGAALRGLLEKTGEHDMPSTPALQWPFWRAGVRFLADRGRTLTRRLLRPWLMARPELGNEWPMERLAVVAFGYLGDLVILQSALRGVVQAYPHLTVFVLAPASGRVAIGRVRRVVVSSPPGMEADTPEAVDWLARWLHDVQPDAIIAPYLHEPWGQTLTALAQPPRPVAGFDNDSGLAHLRHLERLSVRVHKNLEQHEVANLVRLLGAVGLPCEPQPALAQPDPAALGRVREHAWLAAGTASGPLVMLNPDAGHAQKEWTEAKWASLAGMIMETTDWRLVVNASRPRPGLEAALCKLAGGERICWLRAAPLDELVAWLSLCRGLTTVDAGPQHLAHALGVPSVTLYGPMDERRWADHWKRPLHRTVRACAFDLTPEERRGLPANHLTALIEPETVLEQLRELLAGETGADPTNRSDSNNAMKVGS